MAGLRFEVRFSDVTAVLLIVLRVGSSDMRKQAPTTAKVAACRETPCITGHGKSVMWERSAGGRPQALLMISDLPLSNRKPQIQNLEKAENNTVLFGVKNTYSNLSSCFFKQSLVSL